jgi:hypothetical protein
MLDCDCKQRELLREAARERLARSVLKARREAVPRRPALALDVDLALGLGPLALIWLALQM